MFKEEPYCVSYDVSCVVVRYGCHGSLSLLQKVAVYFCSPLRHSFIKEIVRVVISLYLCRQKQNRSTMNNYDWLPSVLLWIANIDYIAKKVFF